MKVRQLTLEQKNQLVGQTYDGEQYFNPTLDADGNWFISNGEVNACTTIAWLSTLPEIDHNPVVISII